KIAAYGASVDLAKEKGAFPAFSAEGFLASSNAETLPDDLKHNIARYGIRNGCLTTIAPTGTTSLLAGNVSSGIEPVFADRYERRVLQPDGSHRTVVVEDYATALHRARTGRELSNDIQPSVEELTPADHIRMQCVAQHHIDSAISKTINCPEALPFSEFEAIYLDAFDAGLKGCTTYRPNPTTGSVLSASPGTSDTALTSHDATLSETEVRTFSVDDPVSDLSVSDVAAWPLASDEARLGDEAQLTNIVYLPRQGGEAHAVNASSAPANARSAPLTGRSSTTYTEPLADGSEVTVTITRGTQADLAHTIVLHIDQPRDQIWLNGLARMMNALIARGLPLDEVANTIAARSQTSGSAPTSETSAWDHADSRTEALLLLIGAVLRAHARADVDTAHVSAKCRPRDTARPQLRGQTSDSAGVRETSNALAHATDPAQSPSECPNCGQPTRIRFEGCWVCHDCGAAACG
ncbi:MAG: hypothetical protein AAFR23_10690, partial [Pseudomonadota bacterium]